jgi:DNA-binding CsgD family transcriptional regulator
MQPDITLPAAAATLDAFIAGPVINNDEFLKGLLRQADLVANATLIILDLFGKTTLHVGEGMSALCGYPPAIAVQGGAGFVMKITNPADIPYLMLLQAGYVQEAKSPGFDPASLRFHDYYWSMICKEGTKVPVLSTGVVLTFTAQNDLGVCVAFHVRNDQHCDSVGFGCKELLLKIKQRHNEIYRHPVQGEAVGPYPLQHVNLTTDLITQRERQVLGMLAQGHSTLAIADVLEIAPNTVESHRKKLLQKFHAKNTAELIMKASKVFWFK